MNEAGGGTQAAGRAAGKSRSSGCPLCFGKLEFRSDFFNILNRPNFVAPQVGQNGGNTAAVVYADAQDSERPLATAGRLTSTSSSSRQIQFALKLLF